MGARLALALALVLVGAGWVLADADRGTGDSIATVPAPGDQRHPVLAFDGTTFLVAWTDHRAGNWNWDVYGTRVSADGVVLDPAGIAISNAPYEQRNPDVAFDGSNYLVAWDDARAAPEVDVYASRVTPAGSVLDPNGIAVTTASNAQFDAALEFDGTNYLLVWEDWRAGFDIYGSRVSRTGTVLDPGGIQISQATAGQLGPALAFDGTNYLAAWWDDRSGTAPDIYGTRVSPAGAILDPAGIAISTAYGYQRTPEVAFGGNNYLVAWDDGRTLRNHVYGSRVTPAGSVLDPDGIATSTTAYVEPRPAIAFDGTNYLVAWTDGRSRTNGDIYAARVSQTGEVLDPNGILISAAAHDQSEPTVAFDGADYLVAWTDRRSGGDSDIYGARVAANGTVLDAAGLLLSTVPYAPSPRPPPSPPPPPPPPPPNPPPPPKPPSLRCVVPSVVQLRLDAAKRKIRQRHCSVGRVRRTHSSRVGRVVAQRPRAGAIKRRGSPVTLVVGR